MLLSGPDPESYITEYTLVFEEKVNDETLYGGMDVHRSFRYVISLTLSQIFRIQACRMSIGVRAPKISHMA